MNKYKILNLLFRQSEYNRRLNDQLPDAQLTTQFSSIVYSHTVIGVFIEDELVTCSVMEWECKC